MRARLPKNKSYCLSVWINVLRRYCRADDRGDPVIQLAPPLICTQEHFNEIEVTLARDFSRLPSSLAQIVCVDIL